METLNICLNKLKSNFHFFLFSLTGLQTNQCDLYFWRLLRILIPISQESAGRKSWEQTKKDNLFLYFRCFKKKLLMRNKKSFDSLNNFFFFKVDSLVASSFFFVHQDRFMGPSKEYPALEGLECNIMARINLLFWNVIRPDGI